MPEKNQLLFIYFWYDFEILMKIPACVFHSDFRYTLQFSSIKGSKGPQPKQIDFLILILFFNFQILCLIVIVSTMNCKSICLSVSKTYIVSTLAPTVQGSTTAVVSCCSLRSSLSYSFRKKIFSCCRLLILRKFYDFFSCSTIYLRS